MHVSGAVQRDRLLSEEGAKMKTLMCGVAGCALLVLATRAHAFLPPVPEIDAGSAMTALGVLAGIVALAVERLRRK